jgi:hypothetical protein
LISVEKVMPRAIVLSARISDFVVSLFSHEMICDRKDGYFSQVVWNFPESLTEAFRGVNPTKMF